MVRTPGFSASTADHPFRVASGVSSENNMYYVYIIKSTKKDYHYIGYTEDLIIRIKEHNQGKTKSIKHLIPFELVYYEAYTTRTLARKRELALKKSGYKKEEVLKRIK